MKEETLFFKRKSISGEKLKEYGFALDGDAYVYEKSILGGDFLLKIKISEGRVFTELFDAESGDEYVLHNISSSQGAYVGSVRAAYEEVLSDIRDRCCYKDVFKTQNAKVIIEYAREKYGDELEFLWEKFPEDAVLRRRDSKKWYAAILTAKRSKIGLCGEDMAEIIDLRIDPSKLGDTLDGETYLPGYHMNKKSWYTIPLDADIPEQELCKRLDDSYELAKDKK